MHSSDSGDRPRPGRRDVILAVAAGITELYGNDGDVVELWLAGANGEDTNGK